MREHIMAKATLGGFVEFVQAMPSEVKIDNTDWSTCAVGEYLRSVNGYSCTEEGYIFANNDLTPLGYAPLGSCTYGKMQKYLVELGY
jgi:hypothetical protein